VIESQSPSTRTEAVAVFQDAASLQDAIDEILSSGFDRSEISLLASDKAVEEKLGHAYKKTQDLEDDASAPRVAYVSTETIGDAEGGLIGAPMYVAAVTAAGVMVASGGTLAGAVAVAAMAGGAGALIGSVLARLVGDHHAAHLREQIEHGGLLLWVRTRDKAHEHRAVELLSKHSAQDVHVHALSDIGAG
jgi:hypothetical protein